MGERGNVRSQKVSKFHQFPERFTEKSSLSIFLKGAIMLLNGRIRGGNNGGTRERTLPESFKVSANSQKVLAKNRLCLPS